MTEYRRQLLSAVIPIMIKDIDDIADIFNIFQDGDIIEYENINKNLILTVEIQYLAERVN